MSTWVEHFREFSKIMKHEEMHEFLHSIDISELLDQWRLLTEEEADTVFKNLPATEKRDLIVELPDAEQERIIRSLSAQNKKELFKEMEPDDLVDIVQTVSHEVRNAVWESLSDDAKKETLFLLRFEEDDAAGLMTPRYLAIRALITVQQAIHFIRNNCDKVEYLYNIYVLDDLQRLIGIVSIKDILAAKDGTLISGIMDRKFTSVREDTDQEEVAKILEANDLISVPVVDQNNLLLGDITFDDIMDRKFTAVREDTDQEEVAKILEANDLISVPVVDQNNLLLGDITFDDVMDVIREEQTEDIYKMNAIAGAADDYTAISIWGMVKKRVPWLILLLLVGTITTNVLKHYEHIILGAAFLFIFMPVITETGGNTGSQASTLMIRGLATGDIHFREIWGIILKELFIGLIMGIITGIVLILRSILLPPGLTLPQSFAIGASLILVVIISNLIGTLAPLTIHKMGYDPAAMSGPLMATIIDVAGLSIYFETARFFLKL